MHDVTDTMLVQQPSQLCPVILVIIWSVFWSGATAVQNNDGQV